MARFVNIGRDDINVDAVKNFYVTRSRQLVVNFNSGEDMVFLPLSDQHNWQHEYIHLGGARHIVQLIPCSEKMHDVWRLDADTHQHFARPAAWLALCADGEVRSVDFAEGFGQFPEDDRNYVGLFRESELSEFGLCQGTGA